MHHARLSKSSRLQRCLRALKRHPNGISTRGLIREAGICAVSSVISELRANGAEIDCRRMKSLTGVRHIYTLRKSPSIENE